MGDIRGGGAPPPEADEIRVATLDEVANEGNWKLHRGGEGRSFRGFDLCESIRVWMQAVAGGTIDSCIYFERIVNNGEEAVELVKCPYAASNRGFVAAPTFRALVFSLLMSVAEDYPPLRWLILIWSIFEVFQGLRGTSRRGPRKEWWAPVFLRGLIPPLVGLMGSTYGHAVFLFLVSALPFHRGTIKTQWVMAPGPMAIDVFMNVLFALTALYFIVFLTAKIPDLEDYTSVFTNPVALLVSPNFEGLEVKLDGAENLGVVVCSFVVYQIAKRSSVFLENRLVMFQGVSHRHVHSRVFYSWRTRSAIKTLRDIVEPHLWLAEMFLSVFGCALVLLVCAVQAINIPIFALTYMAYEIDTGYMMENDVLIMTALNLIINNPGDTRYPQCIVSEKSLDAAAVITTNGNGASHATAAVTTVSNSAQDIEGGATSATVNGSSVNGVVVNPGNVNSAGRHDGHIRRVVFGTGLGTSHGNELPMPIISNERLA